MNQPLPVTLLSGLPGAGKTTLLEHLITHCGELRIAIIRTPSDDLSSDIARIASENAFDAIVVEAPGTADPQALAEALVFDNDIAHLDTLVTVVDAGRFLIDYASAEGLQERGIAGDDDDDRTIVEVLTEQLEFADVIVINKTDLIDSPALAKLKSILHALNPRAELIDARYGAVPVNEVVKTDRFDFDATSSAPGWLAMLNAPDDATVTDAFGVGGFVYRARRPFHPQRLWTLLHLEWPDVLRCKGFFWLATRSDIGGSLSQTGGALRHGPAGMWWAAQDRSEWPTSDIELEAEIAAEWFGDADDMSIGDRRQELAMIGVDLDESYWRQAFDACLLTDEEWSLGPKGWLSLSDPFPSWEIDDEDDDHDHHDHHHHHGDHNH